MSTIKQPRRNTAAMSPLLRKGGVHERSKSGERQRQKQTLKRELRQELNRSDNGRFDLIKLRFEAC